MKPPLGTLVSSSIAQDKNGKVISPEDFVRRQFHPVPGQEAGAQKKISEICEAVNKLVVRMDDSHAANVPSQVHGLLVRPSVRKMIGMSGGTPNASIPSWLKYPILRLSHVVRLGAICRTLNVASAKIDFGQEALANVVFGSAYGMENAEQIAGYVLAGSFSTDIGEYANTHPEIIVKILRFRETNEGHNLRSHIRSHLMASEGNEVATAINAGLKQMIPLSVLEAARSGFTKLHIAQPGSIRPMIWHDLDVAHATLGRWRKASLAQFVSTLNALKKGPYDLCPCGSGEKVRFCCGEALVTK